MRAVVFDQPGDPSVLKVNMCMRPEPSHDEVLIEVFAAGVNRPDCAQRQGTYPPPTGASDILGLEVSGSIVACGDKVKRWKVGDVVCALVAGGGYAEYVTAPEGQCLPVPEGLSLIEAAALPETFFTVWANVFESGHLTAGESALIHGGSGGIGTTAIQLAHAFGARVFTTVGKRESQRLCIELGAEQAILYKEEDFVQQVKSATQNEGVNLVLDMIGGDYFHKNIEVLAPLGRLVQIATLHGANVQLDLRKMMSKRLVITGSTLRPRSIEEKSRLARELELKVWPLITKNRIKPQVQKIFPLEQAREAHEYMESSSHVGKIVLRVR